MRADLEPGERLVLLILGARADARGHVSIGTRKLAEECGWAGRTTARRHLRGLEERGVIERHQERGDLGDQPNTYIVTVR